MTVIGQRRVAGATALMIMLYLLQVVLLQPPAANAAAPAVTYGSATVDGDIGEWDLGSDFFADLILAGGNGGQTDVLGTSYVRYDCSTGALYVLALSEGDFDGLSEAWVKLYDLGNSEANTSEAIVYDGDTPVGFETVVPGVAEGDHSIEIHFNNDGDTASSGSGGIGLQIDCPGPEIEVTVNPCDDGVRTVSFTVPEGYAFEFIDGDGVVGGEYTAGSYEVELPIGSYDWILYEAGDPDKTPLDEGSIVVLPCDEELETVVVGADGVCVVDEGVYASIEITVTPSGGATVTVTGPEGYSDSGSASGALDDGPLGAYSWTADEADGFDIVGDDSGDFEVEDCSTDDTSPPPSTPPRSTPPPSTPEEPAVAGVVFDLACDDTGAYVAMFSLPNSSGKLDMNGDGEYGPGEFDLASETYELTGTSYKWEAIADPGSQFPAGTITSGSGLVSDIDDDNCVVVMGTTVTTIPEVVAETLPFTGFETEDTLKVGLLALIAGGLLLFAARGPKEEEAVAAAASRGGWTNL